MRRLKSLRWLLLISGVLLVALGICTLFTPAGGLASLAVFISVVMLVSGVSEIISYFGEDDWYRSGWELAGGILSALLYVCYAAVFLLSIFTPNSFVAVAFDSGGVTTGPMTVPFILAMGVGLASCATARTRRTTASGPWRCAASGRSWR